MAPLEIRHRSVRPISAKHAQASRFLQQSRPAHLLTMAPTRSGKGVGTIIPNLLTIDRSVICIDPKGENARGSEEHTSELQSLMRISYAVFCLKKKTNQYSPSTPL